MTGQFYKAYHYIELGRKIEYPNDDILFVEKFPHEGGFEYEASIVEYYIFKDKERGLRSVFKYLSKRLDFSDNVISNMKFYIEKIRGIEKSIVIKSPFSPEFNPTAISVYDYPYANARFVNYNIDEKGAYIGVNGQIYTKNACINLETGDTQVMEVDTDSPFKSSVSGVEDIRVYKFENKLFFAGVSYYEYAKDKIAIVHGEYDTLSGKLVNVTGINSPFNHQVEKNWLNITGTDLFVYGWYPLRIGKIRKDKFIISKQIDTPLYFSLFRGSTPSIEVDGVLYILVHMVEHSTPRKYYHLFVQLEKDTFKPLRCSLPFYFRKNEIEYCISLSYDGNDCMKCYTTLNDKNPCEITISLKELNWITIGNE